MPGAPLPGDFGLCRIDGGVGFLIRLGQWLNGGGFADLEHAFLYIGDGRIIEAQPGGAVEADLAEYADRPIVWSTGRIPLTDEQRPAIVAAARSYLGVPYGFADYLALAARRFHIPVPGLRRWIAGSHSVICSQLVDQAYQDAGVHLFIDGRAPGDVTPADLYKLIR